MTVQEKVDTRSAALFPATLILPLGYFAYLFLVRVLLNDVLGVWLDEHVGQDVLGSSMWALIKAGHWCAPIVLYLAWRSDLFRYLARKYGRVARVWPLALVPLGWGVLLLLQDHGRVPPLSFYIVLNSIVVTPIVEELAFRGFLLDALTPALGSPRANVLQALLFSLIHLPWLYALGLFANPLLLAGRLVFLAFFGVITGYLTQGTRTLWLAMAFHVVNNLLASGRAR